MMPPFLMFLLIVIGLVLLSLAVDRTAMPKVLKQSCWALAICALGLFALYCGLLALDWLGIAGRLHAQTPAPGNNEQAITTAPRHGDLTEKFVSQVPISFALVKAIEFAKNSNFSLFGIHPFGWISDKSSVRMLSMVNAGTAFAVSMGISGTFAYADTGTVTIVLTGLADLGSKFWTFFSQWALQQYFYERTQTRNVTMTTHNALMGTGDGGRHA
jgi:hypothetical protein